MLSTEIEFFTVDGAIFYKMGNVVKVFHVDSHEMINFVLDGMQQFYPKAFEALADCYKACKPNPAYYKYRIAARFIKCNFAALDNKADIENRWFGTFEYVNCPMRGECRLQGIVCSPELNFGFFVWCTMDFRSMRLQACCLYRRIRCIHTYAMHIRE